jgi:hypothetical protein
MDSEVLGSFGKFAIKSLLKLLFRGSRHFIYRRKTWKFLELWVDPVLFPPKVLMLVGDADGSCRIFNPAADYTLVVAHPEYESAQD